MRIGLYISTAGNAPLDAVIRRFETAEALGFDTAWVGHTFDWDALGLLALAGRATRRIELGSWVVPTFPRHPLALAQQALTVQRAAAGRLALGIGVSHTAVVGKRMGLDDRRPLRHMRGVLDVLPDLLRGERVDYRGETLRISAALETGEATAPPVVLAALGPRMLELAGERADGVAIWLGGPKFLEQFALPHIERGAARRDTGAPRVLSGLPICVTHSPAARDGADRLLALSAKLPAYRRVLEREGATSPGAVAIAGDESSVARRLEAIAALGVTDFNAVLFPVDGDPEAESRTRDFLATLSIGAA